MSACRSAAAPPAARRRVSGFALPAFLALVSAGAMLPRGVAAGGPDAHLRFKLQVDRYGPVVVGMTPAQASAALGVPLAMVAPAEMGQEELDACHYEFPRGNRSDLGFMVERGTITRIDVFSRKVAATGGIRVGDGERAVVRAFAGKVREEPHPYLEDAGKYLVVEAKPGHAFIFETEKGRITSFRSGRLESVRYIEGCL